MRKVDDVEVWSSQCKQAKQGKVVWQGCGLGGNPELGGPQKTPLEYSSFDIANSSYAPTNLHLPRSLRQHTSHTVVLPQLQYQHHASYVHPRPGKPGQAHLHAEEGHRWRSQQERASRSFLPRRQVLEAQGHHQEALRTAFDTAEEHGR